MVGEECGMAGDYDYKRMMGSLGKDILCLLAVWLEQFHNKCNKMKLIKNAINVNM